MSAPPPKPAKPAMSENSSSSSSSSSSAAPPAATADETVGTVPPASEDTAPASVFQFSETASKNVADILALDSEDESLRRYKESLLGSAAHGDLGDTTDPRRLVVTEFAVVFEPSEGQPDIVHHLDTEEGCARLRSEGIQMKEGVKFKFRISFRVQVFSLTCYVCFRSFRKYMFCLSARDYCWHQICQQSVSNHIIGRRFVDDWVLSSFLRAIHL